MLSRFAPVGTGFSKSLLSKYQPICMVVVKNVTTQTPDKAASTQTPANSSKRDLVNFPRLERLERAPPTKLGFIPETWFQFLYPKTGVTGPYMLGVGTVVYMLSKEVLPIEHNFIHTLAFLTFVTFVHVKFGDKIGDIYNKMYESQEKEINDSQDLAKEVCRENIESIKNMMIPENSVLEIFKAKKENVMLQLEAAYRERLEEAHIKTKKILDYHVELRNVENRIAQKNLYDYVVKNVLKSITADQEKLALENCIKDLNALAARA